MIRSLQSLRFVFVMLVFMSHFGYGDISAFDAGGDCGVAFFFLLSGYVLSLRYGRELESGTFRFGRFLAGCAAKMWPIHLLCLAAFVALHFRTMEAADWLALLPNTLLLQSWWPVETVYFSGNSVSWFLSTLLFLYALFPVLYKKTTVGVAVVSACIYAVAVGGLVDMAHLFSPDYWIYVNPVARLVDFMLGIGLHKYCRRHALHSSGCRMAVLQDGLCVALLAVSLASYPYLPAGIRTSVLFWPACILAVLLYGKDGQQARSPLARLLNQPALVWAGNLVMSFFMVHQMVIYVVLRMSVRLTDGRQEGLVLAVSIGCSLLSASLVNRFWVVPMKKKCLSHILQTSKMR